MTSLVGRMRAVPNRQRPARQRELALAPAPRLGMPEIKIRDYLARRVRRQEREAFAQLLIDAEEAGTLTAAQVDALMLRLEVR